MGGEKEQNELHAQGFHSRTQRQIAHAPLADGWRERVSLHQLHPLMLHAVLFRGGYVGQSLATARRWA